MMHCQTGNSHNLAKIDLVIQTILPPQKKLILIPIIRGETYLQFYMSLRNI